MNTENNKIIAEFMSPKLHMESQVVTQNLFKYHSDWNWLMEVVEKIESLGFGTSIVGGKNGFACVVTNGIENSFVGNHKINSTKIQAVYNACVEFIKWHNEQK